MPMMHAASWIHYKCGVPSDCPHALYLARALHGAAFLRGEPGHPARPPRSSRGWLLRGTLHFVELPARLHSCLAARAYGLLHPVLCMTQQVRWRTRQGESERVERRGAVPQEFNGGRASLYAH
jgi:hypothetical protein